MNSGDTQKQLEPLYDSGGQATGAVAAMQDLTRCTRAEQVLGESEERFRTVVEASKDAIITIDRDGLITVFNPAAEHMFGHKSQEILGQPVHVLMPEEHRQRHHQAREEYFATGKPRGLIGKTVELSALRANGQVFWIELSLSEGRLDGGPFVVGVIRDIADRKLAEQVVRAKRRAVSRSGRAFTGCNSHQPQQSVHVRKPSGRSVVRCILLRSTPGKVAV